MLSLCSIMQCLHQTETSRRNVIHITDNQNKCVYSTAIYFIICTNMFLFQESILEYNALIPLTVTSLKHLTISLFVKTLHFAPSHSIMHFSKTAVCFWYLSSILKEPKVKKGQTWDIWSLFSEENRKHIITRKSLWSAVPIVISTEKLQCHVWVDCTAWYIAGELMWHCMPVQDSRLLKNIIITTFSHIQTFVVWLYHRMPSSTDCSLHW